MTCTFSCSAAAACCAQHVGKAGQAGTENADIRRIQRIIIGKGVGGNRYIGKRRAFQLVASVTEIDAGLVFRIAAHEIVNRIGLPLRIDLRLDNVKTERLADDAYAAL